MESEEKIYQEPVDDEITTWLSYASAFDPGDCKNEFMDMNNHQAI